MATPTTADLKTALRGRWKDTLVALTAIDANLLDGKPHPCPKCDGTDRFRMIDRDEGAIYCNQCFSTNCGDGLAALMWLNGWSFPEAVQAAANYAGLRGDDDQPATVQVEPFELVAKMKSVSVNALTTFGAKVSDCGTGVKIPMYGADYKCCSDMLISPKYPRGRYTTGKPVGVFRPGRRAVQSESVCLCESVKDAMALTDLGKAAFALPGAKQMQPEWARMFQTCHVVLVFDRDKAGDEGAKRTASILYNIAASIKKVELPIPWKETKGNDVRDILKREGGRAALTRALADALPMTGEGDVIEKPKGFNWLSCRELDGEDYRVEFLIENVFA